MVWYVDRGGYVELGESGFMFGEFVDVWCFDYRVVGVFELIGLVLVSDDVEDIWVIIYVVVVFWFRIVWWMIVRVI